MPVYNGANYVRVAIASCLDQDFADLELIITDNASTDETEEICREFAAKDSRVRYVRNPDNLGAAPNYNLGFGMARGRYFKWCAHDDFISRDYLSATVAALEAAPAATLAFTRTQCVDEAGAPLDLVGTESAAIGDSDPHERFARALRQMGTCYAIFGLFRTDALRKSSLHRPYYGSDRALLAELALLGPFVRTEKGLFFNREHQTRSVHLVKKAERRTWQASGAARFAAAEHINFALHLLEIAGRHKQVVSPLKAKARAARFALQPRRVPRYAFELLTFASPGLADFVKHKVLQLRDLAPVEAKFPNRQQRNWQASDSENESRQRSRA
jgi:glycosyltransferase involved in cell wall biosynthesis